MTKEEFWAEFDQAHPKQRINIVARAVASLLPSEEPPPPATRIVSYFSPRYWAPRWFTDRQD